MYIREAAGVLVPRRHLKNAKRTGLICEVAVYHGGTRLSPSKGGAPLQAASGRVAFTPVETWLREANRRSAHLGGPSAIYGADGGGGGGSAKKGGKDGKKAEKTWEAGDAVAGSTWKRPLDRAKKPAWHSLGITPVSLSSKSSTCV